MNERMFIDHSIDPYMGRSSTGCRASPNTQLKNKTVSGHTTILLLNAYVLNIGAAVMLFKKYPII
jgi:hypothetical protein